MRRIDMIVVHCLATRPDQDVGVDWVRDLHVKKNGWTDGGYHYVIRRSGAVETGRDLSVVGAHAVGYNTRSIGIAYAGGVGADGQPEANPTPEQLVSLRKLIEELATRWPRAQLIGHGDLPGVKKACPCFDVKMWWESFRVRPVRGARPWVR